MSIKQLLKNMYVLKKILIPIRNWYYRDIDFVLKNVEGLFRGISISKYKKLKELKNKYENERCFIVCTGPSLNYEDLALLKNEYCFGMNSIIKVFDKTDWRPSFYGIQDIAVYDKIASQIFENSKELELIFMSEGVRKNCSDEFEQLVVFPVNPYGHEYNIIKPRFKFSKNPTVNVYDGYSITYSLIQLACYMGFKEIVLLGCDSSYPKETEKQHFVSTGHVDPYVSITVKFQQRAFEKAKEYSEKNGISIINATRGGELEVFKRKSLEEVLGIE